jgi:pimeloyl-ACP methyl ester carboxylesterase
VVSGGRDLGIDGFEYTAVEAGTSTYRVGVAGDGPPVLLLHGFPQYHYCWHRVAPALRGENTATPTTATAAGTATPLEARQQVASRASWSP